ncbi:MAG: hypothetical protein M3455_06015 [Actinomycetota bacterium]|nr:hypothetical protein [Actinomycetota bacterium]
MITMPSVRGGLHPVQRDQPIDQATRHHRVQHRDIGRGVLTQARTQVLRIR